VHYIHQLYNVCYYIINIVTRLLWLHGCYGYTIVMFTPLLWLHCCYGYTVVMVTWLLWLQAPWATLSSIVNKTDEDCEVVPAGPLGDLQVDSRLIMIKDRKQRVNDAINLRKTLQDSSTMWRTIASHKSCEFQY